MKNVKKLFSVLILTIGFLTFGASNQASAQGLFVINNTSCDIRFQTAESFGCSSCNISLPQTVAAGGGTAFVANTCSNYYEGIKYQPGPVVGPGPSPATSGGVSYNPVTACAPNTNGICGGAPISHTWANFGFVTVHTFN